MLEQCAVSCQACEQKRRSCDRPADTPPIVAAGGINETMVRILRDFPQYRPTALSRPGGGGKLGAHAPWVITFENFLTAEEREAFKSTCADQFARSLAGDQLSPVRTSYQCWCSQNACERHELTQRVAERISNVTRSPVRYMEPFQVVRYEVGQFYRVHHDQNSGLFTPQGPRVYTFFMYLSTPEVRTARAQRRGGRGGSGGGSWWGRGGCGCRLDVVDAAAGWTWWMRLQAGRGVASQRACRTRTRRQLRAHLTLSLHLACRCISPGRRAAARASPISTRWCLPSPAMRCCGHR